MCDSRVTSITVVLPLPLGPRMSVRGGVNVIACAGGCQNAVREVRRTRTPSAPCARGTGTSKTPKRSIHCAAAGFRGWHAQREHASAFCRPALAQGRSSVCLGCQAYQWWSSFPGCATPNARNLHAEPLREPR